MKKQTVRLSVLESIANTVIGLVSSFLMQLFVFPLFGINISHSTNIQLTFIFFVISFARSYIIRRCFNKIKNH